MTDVGHGMTVDGTISARQATKAGECVVLGDDLKIPSTMYDADGEGEWETIDPSNWPTDFVAGDLIKVVFDFQLDPDVKGCVANHSCPSNEIVFPLSERNGNISNSEGYIPIYTAVEYQKTVAGFASLGVTAVSVWNLPLMLGNEKMFIHLGWLSSSGYTKGDRLSFSSPEDFASYIQSIQRKRVQTR